MGSIRIFSVAFVLLMLFHGKVLAQNDELHEDLQAFFERDTPALLFDVDALDLQSYRGGIGVMLPGSDTFQWRFSLGPSFSNSMEEQFWKDTVRKRTTQESFRLSLECAPIWVLGSYGRIAVTVSPVVGYTYIRDSYDYREVYPHGVQPGYEGIGSQHIAIVGGRFGAGVALTEGLFLLAEYQLRADYLFLSDETIHYSMDGSPPLSREDRLEKWSMGNYVTFSLGVRL